MHKLSWKKLLSPVRIKAKRNGPGISMGTGVGREEIERDFDRILFSAPIRRLADKTQVFPLEENDSVRTRLTHSHEVSNLARSIGIRLAFNHAEKVFGSDHEKLLVKRNIPSLLAAVGLSHDLGNPPFGHQGEFSITQWFKDKNEEFLNGKCHEDFLKFDGNAQTFRLITHLQILKDRFGLNLTCATLAGLLKYPILWDSKNTSYKKFGIFESERAVVNDVWEETGLTEGVRHPLAFIMEACDDIAYSVLDAEDTVKKGYASFYDLVDFLEHDSNEDDLVKTILKTAKKENQKIKVDNLSSLEINDLSMQLFRVKAIFEMVSTATETFVEKIDCIMSGEIAGDFELIKNSKAKVLCKKLKDFDKRHGFKHKDVLKLELEGNNFIKKTMDMFWYAINNDSTSFGKYAYQRISENYRRSYEETGRVDYNKCQLLCDVISGMTDSHLIKTHNELKPLYKDALK